MKEVSLSEAINRKYPEGVTMVVAIDEDGTPNAMPAGWCMFTSGEPIMLAVSIGFKRYTHKLLKNSDEFVVTYPSEIQKEDVLYCGSISGADVNKFKKTNLKIVPASKLKTPLIEDSVVCFECKKRGSVDTGDHTIFIGEIVAAHISEKYSDKIYTFGQAELKTISELKKA